MTLRFLLFLGLTGAVAPAPTPPPPCEATRGRQAEYLAGIVHRDSTFELTTPGGWVVTLRPTTSGWALRLSEAGRNGHDLSALTPPWHFVPNPRDIEGWHFRNSDNSGPNDGSVNAPSLLRGFIFSPWVGRGISYRGSATSDADVRKVGWFGRGWLSLEAFELTPPRPGERAAFVWLRFSVCLTWPLSYRGTPDSSGPPPHG